VWSLLCPVMDRMCCSGSTASTVLESSMMAGVKTGQMFIEIVHKIIQYFELLNFYNQRAVV